jgi:hypothetical protein
MRFASVTVLVAIALQSAVASAEIRDVEPVPAERQLDGLTPEEASALIAQLEDAQRQLEAGQSLSFELLAGSIASNAMTKSPPLDVFLSVQFKDVWNIRRVRTSNRVWQPFRLSYSPDGLGKLYWDIEVVLGFNGNIERVLMVYKPPAPF